MYMWVSQYERLTYICDRCESHRWP